MKRLILALALALLALPGAAAAQVGTGDIAILIGNGRYATPEAGFPDVPAQIEALGAAYVDAGYEVLTAEDATGEVMAALLRELEEAGPGGEESRLVVHYIGHTLRAGGLVWLAPVDVEAGSLVETDFSALSIRLLYRLMRLRAGTSVLLIGTREDGFYPDAAAAPGAGWLNPPAGVVAVTGPPRALTEATLRDLLVPGQELGTALATLGPPLSVFGRAGEGTRMAAAEGLQPRPLPLPVPVVPAEPEVDPAEAAEAALNLSRNARRAIQRDLTTLGYDTRGIDGIFGPGTRGAIEAWQPPAGYAPTGFLNTQQIRRLAQMAEARRAEIARAEEAARQAAEAERLARERADNDWWARTGALGTEAGYDAYLGRYPNGLHADEARRELAFLRARPGGGFVTPEDRALWRQARELDRIEGYEEYLYRQPRGAFRDEASARIEELRRERRRERNAVWQEQESRLGLGTIQWLAIETRLASAGYPVGRVDGRIDRDTRRALREFQRRNGIEVTGYITSSGQIPLILSGR